MKTQQDVKNELKDFIAKHLPSSNLSVDVVKKWIYEENGFPLEAVHEFQDKFMKHFKGVEVDLNEVLRISTEAWNYFPHKTLGGKSPQQIIKEHKNQQ